MVDQPYPISDVVSVLIGIMIMTAISVAICIIAAKTSRDDSECENGDYASFTSYTCGSNSLMHTPSPLQGTQIHKQQIA